MIFKEHPIEPKVIIPNKKNSFTIQESPIREGIWIIPKHIDIPEELWDKEACHKVIQWYSKGDERSIKYEFKVTNGKLTCLSHTENISFEETEDGIIMMIKRLYSQLENKGKCPFNPDRI